MNASYTSCASLHGGIDQYDRWFTFTDDPRGWGEGKDEVVRKRGCSSGWQMNFSITNPEKNQL